LDRLPKDIEDALVADLQNPATFWAKYPVPIVAMNEETEQLVVTLSVPPGGFAHDQLSADGVLSDLG